MVTCMAGDIALPNSSPGKYSQISLDDHSILVCDSQQSPGAQPGSSNCLLQSLFHPWFSEVGVLRQGNPRRTEFDSFRARGRTRMPGESLDQEDSASKSRSPIPGHSFLYGVEFTSLPHFELGLDLVTTDE